MIKHQRMIFAAVLVLSLFTLTPGVSPPADTRADIETEVRQFVDAFNARNIDAMLALVDEKIQWLSVNEAKVTIETEGKQALRASMERYFRGCPTCKSSLEWVRRSGSRVAATERATWTSKTGLKSQRSLSVYEFRYGKIIRVYYFPVEAGTASNAKKGLE